MAAWVCLGALAAFGLLCALWTAAGWLLSSGVGGSIVCLCRPGGGEGAFVRRSLWLKSVGLLNGTILLVDGGLSGADRAMLERLAPDVQLCSPEELLLRLEVERKRIGGTGT